MRLHLISPPQLVTVDDGGVRRSGLLLAERGERRYVSISRGPGLNHLRWVPGGEVGPAGEPSVPSALPTSAVSGVRRRR